MGIFEPLPVAWDCLHCDALSAAELTTLNDARGMLLAVCAVDQISEESVDSLLSEAWQGQEAPLVLAARVLRRICAMDVSPDRSRRERGAHTWYMSLRS